MFNFIRNFFLGKKQPNVVTWSGVVWNGGSNPFLTTEDFGIHFPKYQEKEPPWLTQSELQMLQRIVAEKISNLESDVAFCKHDASVYGKGSEERDFLFKEASKKQDKINKLSALQYRLKHKIAAKG